MSINTSTVKRGDTIIEVMIAFAIFSLVAIISIAMMNSGLSASERSLELVTARNELNAQAEALRFIHSSYIAEATLPQCGEVASGERCQQYDRLWSTIVNNTINLDEFKINYPPQTCREIYDDSNGKNVLFDNHAFVLNTRKLNSANNVGYDARLLEEQKMFDGVYLEANKAATNEFFSEPPMNARIIYTKRGNADDDNSSEKMSNVSLSDYTNIAKVEGIWIVGVKGPAKFAGGEPQYYDFYIETCWYGSNASAPTSIDTVVRLYNPEGV